MCLQEHPRDVVVMLVGGDHVKYGMGAPARLERLLATLDVKTPKGRGTCSTTSQNIVVTVLYKDIALETCELKQ
jgi:uncharacterized iron-regulated protein